MRIVVVTGMSGSGKTAALHALEDMGFYAVDNLPLPLMAQFVDLLDKTKEANRAALVIDARSGALIKEHARLFTEVRGRGHQIEVMYLDAPEDVLVRRFSETRRRHPLAHDNVRDGLEAERKLLDGLRQEATNIIDTGPLNAHQLRRLIWERYGNQQEELSLTLMSFGFKLGIPAEADIVLDVRFLPNPFFDPELTRLTGRDNRVASFVMNSTDARSFLEKAEELLSFLFPLYVKEGKSYLTVAMGCTGGRHRSVAMAEALRAALANRGIRTSVRHRDIDS